MLCRGFKALSLMKPSICALRSEVSCVPTAEARAGGGSTGAAAALAGGSVCGAAGVRAGSGACCFGTGAAFAAAMRWLASCAARLVAPESALDGAIIEFGPEKEWLLKCFSSSVRRGL